MRAMEQNTILQDGEIVEEIHFPEDTGETEEE